jgi:hypothetical protein
MAKEVKRCAPPIFRKNGQKTREMGFGRAFFREFCPLAIFGDHRWERNQRAVGALVSDVTKRWRLTHREKAEEN